MKIILYAATPLLAFGCAPATEISYPISGRLNDGTEISGHAIARSDGRGTFTVAQPGVMKCSGEYDAASQERIIRAPFKCTDGRSGEVVTTRNAALDGGSSIATFENGESVALIFGEAAFR